MTAGISYHFHKMSPPATKECTLAFSVEVPRTPGIPSLLGRVALLFLCLLLPAPTWSQIRSGSIVVMNRSRQKVILAADSRVNLGDGKYDDSACKITALGDNLIFAATGIVGDSSHFLPENLRFGATEEARNVFHSYAKTPEDFLDLGRVGTIASNWGAAMARRFRLAADASPASFREWLKRADLSRESTFSVGLFVGLEANGNVAIYSVNVDYAGPQKAFGPAEPFTLTSMPLPERAPNDFSLTQAFGMAEIFDEIKAGTTGRAKQELEARHYLETTLSADAFAKTQVIRMVDLTIAYHPKQEFVGGKIDAAELAGGGKVNWIQRKENCPPD